MDRSTLYSCWCGWSAAFNAGSPSLRYSSPLADRSVIGLPFSLTAPNKVGVPAGNVIASGPVSTAIVPSAATEAKDAPEGAERATCVPNSTKKSAPIPASKSPWKSKCTQRA